MHLSFNIRKAFYSHENGLDPTAVDSGDIVTPDLQEVVPLDQSR